MSDSKIVVINKGQRRFDLARGPKGEKRSLLPGGSIETLNDQEAKRLLGFHEIVDAAKAVPAAAARQLELEQQLARAKAENARLKHQHEAVPAPKEDAPAKKPEPKPEEPPKAAKKTAKKKGK